MATTTFTVTNLNPDFEYPIGFWFDPRNDGGIDLNTDDDGTDDEVIAPNGLTTNDSRGVWVLVDGNTFDIDGDVAVATSQAYILKNSLLDRAFAWTPKNPDYNTVSPYLKDGSTSNPDFDNSGNPVLHTDGSTKASVVGDICRHFLVSTVVA